MLFVVAAFLLLFFINEDDIGGLNSLPICAFSFYICLKCVWTDFDMA